MKVLFKVCLGVTLSLFLGGCHGQAKKLVADYPTENQLSVSPKSTHEETSGGQKYQLAYHVAAEQKSLTLWQEVYRDGESKGRVEALTLSQIDGQGLLTLIISPLKGEGYQVELQVTGADKYLGTFAFQVTGAQPGKSVTTTQVTLPTKTVSTDVAQPIFALKVSPEEQSVPLSVAFLKEPARHLAELTTGDVVYVYHCEFKTE